MNSNPDKEDKAIDALITASLRRFDLQRSVPEKELEDVDKQEEDISTDDKKLLASLQIESILKNKANKSTISSSELFINKTQKSGQLSFSAMNRKAPDDVTDDTAKRELEEQRKKIIEEEKKKGRK